jgi:hypothetical protein
MSFKVSRLISPSSFGGNESGAPTISGGGGSSSSSGPTGVYTNLSCTILTGSSGTFTSFRVGTVTGTTGSFGYIGANYLYGKGDSTKIVDIKNSLDVSIFNVDTSSTSTGVVNIQGNLNCNGIITFVDVERVDDGTVLSPAYSFSGDTDCGLYRIDTRNIGMSIGGTMQAHWTVTGLEGTTGSFNMVTGATGSFNIVTSQTGVFSNTVNSVIFTGTTGVFNGGSFNTLSSQTGVFSNTVSAPTGSFTTNVTSPLHTGTTGNFNGGSFNTLASQTGVFSNTVLSSLVTGTTGNFNGGTFNTLASQTGVFSNTVLSSIVTGTTGNFNGGSFNTLASQTGVFSNTVKSALFTGTTGTYAYVSSMTGNFTSGLIVYNGATNKTTILSQSSATTTVFSLPVDNGTSGYALTTNGAGLLSWSSVGIGTGTVFQVKTNSSAALATGYFKTGNVGTTETTLGPIPNTIFTWSSGAIAVGSSGYWTVELEGEFVGTFTNYLRLELVNSAAASMSPTQYYSNNFNQATDRLNFYFIYMFDSSVSNQATVYINMYWPGAQTAQLVNAVLRVRRLDA